MRIGWLNPIRLKLHLLAVNVSQFFRGPGGKFFVEMFAHLWKKKPFHPLSTCGKYTLLFGACPHNVETAPFYLVHVHIMWKHDVYF